MEEKKIKNKEFALHDFLEMVKQSWTWDRMTEDEHNRYIGAIDWAFTAGHIKGSYQDRWDSLQLTYHLFLIGLDYKPIGWREQNSDALKF